ncbi:MAG: hypothetical protein RR301_01560 [Clostridia bacterium]
MKHTLILLCLLCIVPFSAIASSAENEQILACVTIAHPTAQSVQTVCEGDIAAAVLIDSDELPMLLPCDTISCCVEYRHSVGGTRKNTSLFFPAALLLCCSPHVQPNLIHAQADFDLQAGFFAQFKE